MRNGSTAVRVDGDLLDEIDRYAAQLEHEKPGLKVTRADAVRILLAKGLESASKQLASK